MDDDDLYAHMPEMKVIHHYEDDNQKITIAEDTSIRRPGRYKITLYDYNEHQISCINKRELMKMADAISKYLVKE